MTTLEQERMKQFFNAPDRYLKDNFIIITRQKIIRDLTKLLTIRSVLDLGCGNGSLTLSFLPQAKEQVFVDISPNMLSIVRKNIPAQYLSKTRIIQEDIACLKLDRKYDLVVCIGVLAHVLDIEKIFQVISEHVSDDGYVILQNANSDTFESKVFWWVFYPNGGEYVVNKTNSHKLGQLLQQFGLKVIKEIRHPHPFPFIGRIAPNLGWWIQYNVSKIPLINRLFMERILLCRRMKKGIAE
jgi:2-polyprenyl-3-methyl-5-hydroxy-6-metoxy-1,4-benzoquinol methylase